VNPHEAEQRYTRFKTSGRVFRYPNPIQKPLAANRCLLAVQRPSVRPESGPDAGDIREVRQLREWILILRDRVVAKDDPAGPELRCSVEIPKRGCSASAAVPGQIFTVNGTLRPQIDIMPGERQF